MYKALYRKYRPAAFSEVAGQPHITQTLKNQLTAGRLGHAYLFTGSRGTGKTSCAKILAKAANCLSPLEGDPCKVCENCKMAESGAMMDILEIDAASNNGVENIRDLREKAHYTPAAGKYRVYIIDEVHMLSAGAFNALLKTLEEPPAATLFILATTEAHKLPATILSRCQRFDFRRIPSEEMASRLLYVAERESILLDDAAALLIARLSDGALRDALSLLEVCAASGGPVTESGVAAAAGLAGREYLHRLSDAVLLASVPDALAALDELHAASLDMQRLCQELISHFRNLMICKTAEDPAPLVAVSQSELGALKEKARRFSLSSIFHALGLLEDTLLKIGRGASRRTEMELALIRLCNPALDASPEALSRRIEALEQALRGGGFAPAVAAPAANASPRGHEAPRSGISTPAESRDISTDRAVPPPGTHGGPVEGPAPGGRAASGAFPPAETPAAGIPPTETPPIFAPMDAPPGEARGVPADEAPPPPEARTLPPDDGPPPPGKAAEAASGELSPCPFWPELLEALARSNPLIAAALKSADAYLKGDFLLIDPRSEHFAELVNSSPLHRKSIRDAAQAVSGVQYRLGPYTAKKADEGPREEPLDKLRRKLSDAGLLEE